MRKIFLIHGWDGNPSSEPWFSWLSEECDNRNIEIIIPEMPNTSHPKINEWVGKLDEIVNGGDIYFVGHSIGCQAIMRYLEKTGKNISGIVFVAPWMHLDENTIEEEGQESIDIAKPWVETPINFEKVKICADKILAIFSNDDPFVPVSEIDLFRNELGAEIIVKDSEGHFNDTEEINEIFEVIK